jgi:multiple sugar transport system permease protein
VSRQNPKLNTLTTGVATIAAGGFGSGNRYPLKLAAALLMTLPVAIVFLIFQRRFIRGATEGAVKG